MALLDHGLAWREGGAGGDGGAGRASYRACGLAHCAHGCQARALVRDRDRQLGIVKEL